MAQLLLDSHAAVSADDFLEADDQGGPEPDQVSPFSEEVADRALLLGIDVAFRQDAETKQFGQPEGIVWVIGMFQTRVFLDRGGMGQMDLISFAYQRIHHPVAVVSRFHHDADPLVLMGTEHLPGSAPDHWAVCSEKPSFPSHR